MSVGTLVRWGTCPLGYLSVGALVPWGTCPGGTCPPWHLSGGSLSALALVRGELVHLALHSGLKGGVRNFFCRWGQRAYFSQLSRCPGPRSTSPTQNLSNLGPLGPKNSPKRAQVGQNGDLKAPVVPNGWNRVEQRWNGLWEVQVEDFEPIWRSWVPPNLAQGPPKTAQICPTGPNLAI